MRAWHPPLTDFPLALWITSLAFDVVSLWGGNAFVRASYFCIVAGLIVGVVTALAGLRDYSKLPTASPARRLGVAHGVLAVFAFAGFFVSFFLRSNLLEAQSAPLGGVVASAIAASAVGVAGYLGGKMVYRHGANVTPVDEVIRERTPVRPRVPVRP